MSCYLSPYPEFSKFLTKAPLGAAVQAHGSPPASTLLYAPPQFNYALPARLNPRIPKIPSLILNCNAHGRKKPSFPATSIPALQYSRPLIQSTVACFGPRGVERMASHFLSKIEKTLYTVFRLKWQGPYKVLQGLARKIACDFVSATVTGCTATLNSDHMLNLIEARLSDLLAKLERDWDFACRFGGHGGEQLCAVWVERLKRADGLDLERYFADRA